MIHEITDENFDEEVAASPVPCVIEFSASWCTPCKEMVPRLESLSETFGGSVKFCLVNVDEQKKLRVKFAVAAVPFVVFVADGKKTPLFDELVPTERLEERIRFVLGGGDAPTTRPL